MKCKSPRSRYSHWPLILVIMVAGTGIGLSLYIRSRIVTAETETVRLSAEALRLNTEKEINLFVNVLESVRALHALSDAVNQEAMSEFIGKGLVHQQAVLGAFGLAQRIDNSIRIELESMAAQNKRPGYRILQQTAVDTWIPAATRPIYHPLTWQIRKNALNVPIGFDFSSQKASADTIARMEHTQNTTLAPFPIPFSAPDSPSYWVFSPVLSGNASKPGAVIGFAVAIFTPNKLLDRIHELSAPETELHLKLAQSQQGTAETVRQSDGTWIYRCPLEAINANWLFECTLPSGITGHRSETAFVTGLVITALMTSLLLLLGSRTRKIETEVRTRTEDLRIANARLEENLRERAQMEEEMSELSAREQRRIGRDLHDSLGQKLTGAVFLSRSLLNWFKEQEARSKEQGESSQPAADSRELYAPGPTLPSLGPQADHAQTLNETLKSAVSQVRNMARGLASVTLNDESLKESFAQLADEMSSLYEVSCSAHIKGNPAPLERKTKEQLYFIAREAANNAARHAQAKHITIQLTDSDSGWTLRIKDDGRGFSENPDSEGMGLRTMRYRAGRIGAKFSITSKPGDGTAIEVTSNA